MTSRIPLSIVIVFGVSVLAGCGSDSPSDGGTAGTGAGGASGSSSAGTGAGGSPSGGSQPVAGASASAGAGAGAAGSGAGGTSPSGGFPAVDLAADIRSLPMSDKAKLCDWVNEQLGGYGQSTVCSPALTVSNDADQAECLRVRFEYQCKVTVAQLKTCTEAQAPSNACDLQYSVCHYLFCQ